MVKKRHDDDDDDYDNSDILQRLWNDNGDDDSNQDSQQDESKRLITIIITNENHHDHDDPNDESTTTATALLPPPQQQQPPSYLLKAILAGLYELPPPHILQYQTGWGRRIRYHEVRHIPTQFQPLRIVLSASGIQGKGDGTGTGPLLNYTMEYMTLPRYSHFQPVVALDSVTTTIRKRATQCYEFNIYRVQLLSEPCDDSDDAQNRNHRDSSKDSTTTASIPLNRRSHKNITMNDQLRQWAYQEIQHNSIGLNVSNAGGTYHGLPNFFHNLPTPPPPKHYCNHDTIENDETTIMCCHGKQELYHLIRNVMERIEHYESSIQQQYLDSSSTVVSSSSFSGTTASTFGSLALESHEMECWVNVSQTNGSWNRLHTHEGSAYSGVYYVSSSSSSSPDTDTHWNGNFLFKPTPHPLEDTYTLSPMEQCRLRRRDFGDDDHHHHHPTTEPFPYIDEVQYVMIPPVPGTMIIFPSYIHHCVLPLLQVTKEEDENKNDTNHQTNHHTDQRQAQEHTSRISIAFNINWKQRGINK